MEVLILFIVMAVGSTIFSAAKQEANRQKRPEVMAKQNAQRMAPAAGNKNIPSGGAGSKPVKTGTAPRKTPADNSKSMYSEGVQTEGETRKIPDSRSSEAQVTTAPAKENAAFGIAMDDLQRSIVMAEILGKPKALRKN